MKSELVCVAARNPLQTIRTVTGDVASRQFLQPFLNGYECILVFASCIPPRPVAQANGRRGSDFDDMIRRLKRMRLAVCVWCRCGGDAVEMRCRCGVDAV